MGSKVNIKFVAILSAVVVGVVGLLAVPAYLVLTKSAKDHVRAGDKAIESGDIKKAISEYGKAVSDERSNVGYVTKWRNAIESFTPEDQTEYRKYFFQLYGAIYEIAFAARTDLEAWEEYFELASTLDTAARIEERARAAADVMGRTDPRSAAIIRRYVALPKVAAWARGSRQMEPDEIDLMASNLRSALESRSDDHEVVRGLVTLHRVLAAQALDSFDEDAARTHARSAAGVVEAALGKHPNHPVLRMIDLEMKSNAAMRRLLDIEIPEGTHPVGSAAVDEVASLLSEWPAEQITLDSVLMLRALEILSGSGKIAHTLALTERLVGEAPEDMMVRWGRAYALRMGGRPDDAYDELQHLLDRPIQTVSWDGYRLFSLKNQALATQSSLAYSQWEQSAGDEAAQGVAVARLRSRIEEMTRRLPTDSPMLLIARARIAYADGELGEASRLLREYEGRIGVADADANWMLTQLALRAGNLTEAARRMDAYQEQSPGELRALLIRADIHVRLNEFEEAIEILTALARALPDNQQIKVIINGIREQSGEIVSSDPVLAAINASMSAEQGTGDEPGDSEAAAAIIEGAISEGLTSPQLYRRLAQIRMNQGDVPGARDAIERGLSANAGDADLRRFADALVSGETILEISIWFIDTGDGTEVEKLTRKAAVCWQAQAFERAQGFVDQAGEIEPENPAVVEWDFRLAVRRGDAVRAGELAQTAQRLDIDGVGGRTFLADVLEMSDDRTGAIALLKEAVDLRPERVILLRRLGQQQLAAGQITEGLSTFDDAIRLRGNDQSLILDYATQLRSIGRSEQALRLILDKQDAARGNGAIFDLRIDLEAEVGNRQWALETRQTLAQRDPTDSANMTKLARLYMDLSAWDEAKPLLDALRAEGDSLELATLAAQWHGDQGDIDSAHQEFSQYIAALFASEGDLSDPTPYLQLGHLLIRYGDIEGGLLAMGQARRWEDPQTLRVEKFLADRLAGLNRWDDAIESFRKIVDAGMDTSDATYALRLAEGLSRMGRPQEAAEVLASLDHLADRNVTILLLGSQNAMTMGEDERARELVERAIELFPDSARAYLQRARLARVQALETGIQRLLLDAREDLNTATALDPTFVEAFRLRSQVNGNLGELDAMLSDLRLSVFARPPTNATVAQVIGVFIRADRSGGAVEVADYAISTRPNDIGLKRDIGGAFGRGGDWGRASIYYEQAWERTKDVVTSSQYVQSLLLTDPPRHRVALNVLSGLGEEVRDIPGLLIWRAEALKLGGQNDLAIEDVRRAFTLLVDNPQGMELWFREISRIFESTSDLMAVIDAAKRGGQRRLQLDLFAARGLAMNSQTIAQSLQVFDRLIVQTADPAMQRSAYLFKGAALMEHERFEEAVSVWTEGLSHWANEWQFHNNIAYVLGERLKRPQEALPYARSAFELAPRVPAVLDTLGWIQHLVGEDAAAEQSLDQAMLLIGLPENDPTIALHLAIVRAAMGKKEQAQNLVRTIRVRNRNGANLSVTDRELLAEASERIDSLP